MTGPERSVRRTVAVPSRSVERTSAWRDVSLGSFLAAAPRRWPGRRPDRSLRVRVFCAAALEAMGARFGHSACVVDLHSETAERRRLRRRGLRLEYATLGWNVVEIGFLIAAAVAARSVALAGFALDSFIEIFASIVVVWQLKGTATRDRERRAVRLIGLAFFGLAIYITVQAAVTLALDVRPDSSALGIAWLSATCVVMFGLAVAKRRTGKQLGNPVLTAEATVTLVDGALAAGILVGLVMNAVAGWWWADIAAGAIIVVYGIREGREHLRAAV
jgi:divalent metal cation (Fe/Co/Zn/Cd) transporter